MKLLETCENFQNQLDILENKHESVMLEKERVSQHWEALQTENQRELRAIKDKVALLQREALELEKSHLGVGVIGGVSSFWPFFIPWLLTVIWLPTLIWQLS